MKDNVHERLEVCHSNWPRKRTLSLWKIDLEIQPENGFQVIWSPKASEGAHTCHVITLNVWCNSLTRQCVHEL